MGDKFKDSREEILETMSTVSSEPSSTSKKKKKSLRERMLDWLMETPAGSVGAPGGPRYRKQYKEELERTP